jgi:3-dehydroquinate dehydratase II
VDWIQEACESADGIILNAGALTHTSVALLDALSAAELPVIEVHLSNTFRRESFRHHSYVSLAANGVICGLGAQGYELALDAIANLLDVESDEAA